MELQTIDPEVVYRWNHDRIWQGLSEELDDDCISVIAEYLEELEIFAEQIEGDYWSIWICPEIEKTPFLNAFEGFLKVSETKNFVGGLQNFINFSRDLYEEKIQPENIKMMMMRDVRRQCCRRLLLGSSFNLPIQLLPIGVKYFAIQVKVVASTKTAKMIDFALDFSLIRENGEFDDCTIKYFLEDVPEHLQKLQNLVDALSKTN